MAEAVAAALLAAVVEKLVWNQFPHRFSMLILGAFLFLVGMQSVMMGLLAEMQVRTYHESQSKPIYIVRDPEKLRHLAADHLPIEPNS